MLPYVRLDDLRHTRPLIHCIANLVTANDCANVALAAGASPMMAEATEEMEEITAISDATVLNIGTPRAELFESCRMCGIAAGGRPLVLDPVGVGASSWRLRETEALLSAFTPTILRVNLGEAQALLHQCGGEQGVDFTGNVSTTVRLDCARALARAQNCAVLISGPEDIASDGERAYRITGGSMWMPRVTGTGCMLSVLCGVFNAVENDALLAAALAASYWKVCASQAEKCLESGQGTGTFRTALLDCASLLDSTQFAGLAQIDQF